MTAYTPSKSRARLYQEEWATKLHKRPEEIYVPLALREEKRKGEKKAA